MRRWMMGLTLMVMLSGCQSMAPSANVQSELPSCPQTPSNRWHHCLGTLKYANGDKYVGEVKEGKKDGYGNYIFSLGDKYVGEFNNDKANGKGTYTHLANNRNKGDQYIGEFKNDKA